MLSPTEHHLLTRMNQPDSKPESPSFPNIESSTLVLATVYCLRVRISQSFLFTRDGLEHRHKPTWEYIRASEFVPVESVIFAHELSFMYC